MDICVNNPMKGRGQAMAIHTDAFSVHAIFECDGNTYILRNMAIVLRSTSRAPILLPDYVFDIPMPELEVECDDPRNGIPDPVSVALRVLDIAIGILDRYSTAEMFYIMKI